jgi:hypothetical protein
MIQRLISHRKFKRILIFFICLLSVHVFGKLLINYLNDFDDLIMKLKSKNYKTIHMLTGRFFFVNWKLGHKLGSVPFRNCPEKRCYAYRSVLQNPSG